MTLHEAMRVLQYPSVYCLGPDHWYEAMCVLMAERSPA